MTFLQIPKESMNDNLIMQRNKFKMELFERVGCVADKNITKNSFFLKLCKEDLDILDEP